MIATLLETIEETFTPTPETFSRIKKIANDIIETGLSIEECALLSGLSPVELDTIYEACPEVEEYFNLKRLEYKAELLRFINRSAKDKNDTKTILSLMERNFPEEYDLSMHRLRAKNDYDSKEDQENKLVQVFQFIQQSSTTDDLFKQNRSADSEAIEIKEIKAPWKSNTLKTT